MPHPRRLLICLPTTGQSVRSPTAVTIANLVRDLKAGGIHAELHNIDSAEIVTARDMFANMVLHSDAFDALLFIDSDMTFQPRLVSRMIELGENFTAAAYVRRALDLSKLVATARQTNDIENAIAQASSFTLIPQWSEGRPERETRQGFTSMAAVGMGCALISRSVLIDMIEAGLVQRRADLSAGPGKICYSFFEPIHHEGIRLGEDYSFCHRWTLGLGRKLWVCIDEPIGHIGSYQFQANYVATH